MKHFILLTYGYDMRNVQGVECSVRVGIIECIEAFMSMSTVSRFEGVYGAIWFVWLQVSYCYTVP